MQGLDSQKNLSHEKKTIVSLRRVTGAKHEPDQIYRFDKERIVIGSVVSSDIRIQGQGVSPIHAVLEVRTDERVKGEILVTVYDISSQTGVFVNQKRVITHVLKKNDTLTIGIYSFHFSYGELRSETAWTHHAQESQSRVLFYNPKEDLKPLLLEEGRTVEEIFDYRPTSKRALEVVMSWFDTILDVKHFSDVRKVTLGNERGADFGIPPILTESLFPVVIQNAHQMILNIDSQMQGVIQKSGRLMSLEEACAGASRGVFGFEVLLDIHDFAKISIGELDFYFSFTAAPPRLKKRRILDRDPLFIKTLSLSSLFTLMFLVGLTRVNLQREIEVEQVPDRIASLLYEPELFMKIPPPALEKKQVVRVQPERIDEKKSLSQKSEIRKVPSSLQSSTAKLGQEGAGVRASGREGSRGNSHQRRNQDQFSQISRPTPSGATEGAKGASAVQEEGEVDLLKGSGKIKNILGNTPIRIGEGGQRFKGFAPSHTGGSGGLALAGSGQGGGGTAEDQWSGLGAQGSGLGRVGVGAAAVGQGTGRGGTQARVEIMGRGPDEVIVQGAIDRNAVAEALLAHRDEFRYCYEKELNADTPHLSGAVIPEFEIGPSGKVTQAGLKSSSLKNVNVETCVLRVLKRIQFPIPVGGTVSVTYPFRFGSVSNQ